MVNSSGVKITAYWAPNHLEQETDLVFLVVKARRFVECSRALMWRLIGRVTQSTQRLVFMVHENMPLWSCEWMQSNA